MMDTQTYRLLRMYLKQTRNIKDSAQRISEQKRIRKEIKKLKE